MTAVRTEHLTVDERRARGRQARRDTPLAALADLAESDRDPISLLELQAKSRVQDLVPIRYGRMSAVGGSRSSAALRW